LEEGTNERGECKYIQGTHTSTNNVVDMDIERGEQWNTYNSNTI
jgi:hypothetical protein